MDTEPTILRVPSPPRRGTSAVVVIGIVLVAVAILKPWTFGRPAGAEDVPRSGAHPTLAATLSSPAPVATVVIWDPNAMACMSSEGNRVLALLRAPGLEVRTWLTLDDTSLADPLDPAAVPLRLPSSHVIGLGICARRAVQASAVASAAQILDVEAVAPGGRLARDLGVPPVISQQLGIPSLGVLYGPPATLVAPTPRVEGSASPEPTGAEASWPIWPVGDYALAFRFAGDPPSVVRWVQLDILPAGGKYG
jgi:hypothetical protein